MKKTILPVIIALAALAITLNWLNITPAGIYQKYFAVGSTVCHQIPSHSFHQGETQFALCARCSGLYLGSIIGLGYFFTQGKKRGLPSRGYLILLVMLFIVWSGDGLNSFISDFLNQPFLYETTNLTRLATGFGMGLVMAIALMTLFNVSIWKNGQMEALLHHPLQIAGYFAASLVMGLVILNSGKIFFTVLSYISISAVMIIVTMLYTVFWVIMTRNEAQFTNLQPLGIFLVAGFGTAMLQFTLLFLFRGWILG
jgi:uncharacterized membrane protein